MAKDQFVKDSCCSWWDHWNLTRTVQPATMRQAKDSDGEYLIAAEGDGGSGDTLDVWHFPDPIHNPSEFDQATVSVSGYYTPPSAQQPNPNPIDTGDARLAFAVWKEGRLSTGQTTLCGSNACAAFYEIDVSAFPTLSLVNDWALQVAGIDYYYPAADTNKNGDKMMVYTVSEGGPGSGLFPGPDYVGIPNSSRCTGCVLPPQGILAASSSAYAVVLGTPPRNRWGDYLSASADPDGLGVWVAGEFATGPSSWGTQVGVFYNTYVPELAASPTAINFGDKISGPSVARDIKMTNTGNADLTINSVKLAGSSDYSVIGNTCQIPNPFGPVGLLEAKQSCLVTVLFKPSGSGQKKASLEICDSLLQPCLAPFTIPFTFSGPAIGKITPSHAPLVGINVTVDGDGFSKESKFTFGGSPATAVSCASATSCTMTAPAHSAGTVDVVAETGTAKSDSSKFSYQAPAISKISPKVGPTAGGESVTLTGSGFIPGTQLASSGVTPMTIHFGPNVLKSFDCFSDTTCQVASPAGTGQSHITVSLAGVTSTDIPGDVYTYQVFPSVASVTPGSAPVTGGGTVTIVGTNFSTAPGGTLIEFSSLPATNVSCSSPTQCTATVPTRDSSAGYLMADVTATVNDRTSINSVGFAFGKPTDPFKGVTKCAGIDCQH
jgi:hypothetical protein